MNLSKPRPNSKIVIWNSNDEYTDYVYCEVDADGKVTAYDVGSYPIEGDEYTLNPKYADDYNHDFGGFDFDDVCTGLEDSFNDWDYVDDFNPPRELEEVMVESAIKKYKESLEIDDEVIRKAKEEIAKEDIADEGEELDLSELSDENLDTLISQTHEIKEAEEDIDISDIISFLNSNKE